MARDHNRVIDSELLSALQNGQHILCVSHVAPDGDAIGSLLGIAWLLRGLGKTPHFGDARYHASRTRSLAWSGGDHYRLRLQSFLIR